MQKISRLHSEQMGGGIFLQDGTKVENGQGATINLSSPKTIYTEGEHSSTYIIRCYYSGLPIVEITTPDSVPVTSKESWIENSIINIINPDGTIDHSCEFSIKGRGNGTWSAGNTKKGYSLKLGKKNEILGMPAHKRWVLLPNVHDRSLIRNAIGFEISRCLGLDWTPRGRFVELVFNGNYRGNYYLCEQIRIDNDRVDISDLGDNGDNLTGGYILELDNHYDEEFKFKSTTKSLPYMFKDPNTVTSEQFTYIKEYIDDLEESLYDNNRFENNDYLNYIDIESFVNWWIATEVTQNQEPNHPSSCYMHKDQQSKIKMGLVWDFDVYTFNTKYRLDTLAIKNALYYDKLFESSVFVSLLKKRWNEIKPVLQSHIPSYINDVVLLIRPSADLNFMRWPTRFYRDFSASYDGTPYNDYSWFDSYEDYDDTYVKIKEVFLTKLLNIDQWISGLDNGGETGFTDITNRKNQSDERTIFLDISGRQISKPLRGFYIKIVGDNKYKVIEK